MNNWIPDEISNALREAFKDDIDSLARVHYFLTQCFSTNCAEPFIRSLNSVLSHAMLFKKVAKRMVSETQIGDFNEHYQQVVYEIWNNFLTENDIDRPDSGQRWAFDIPTGEGNGAIAQICFMTELSRLTPESLRALATTVNANDWPVALYGERPVTIARQKKPDTEISLVAVYLAANVIKKIWQWWNEEITGEQCVKDIIDMGVVAAAGIGGGIGGEMIGASVGAIFGPTGKAIGALVGAVAGGIFAALSAEILYSRLTQWVFGLPKSEALENAYTFLGVSPIASNSKVNSKYRHLALKYHPEKGLCHDAEKWTRLQYSMAVIRQARGEP